MADIRPFSLGEVLQTSEAIKGMRQQSVTEGLRQKLLGVQTAGAQQAQDYAKAQESRAATQFSQEQQIANTKLLNAAAAEVATNPAAIQRWLPQLQQAGVFAPGVDISAIPPEQLQAQAKELYTSTSAALASLNGPQAGEPLETIQTPQGPKLVPRSRAAYQTPYIKPERPQVVVQTGDQNFETAADKAYGAAEGAAFSGVVERGTLAADKAASLRALRDNPAVTGPTQDFRAAASALASDLGVPLSPERINQIANLGQYQAITESLVLGEQLKQKGPQTESDTKRIKATLAQTKNPGEVNKLVIGYQLALAEREQLLAQLAEQHRTESGTINGWRGKLREYVSSTPLAAPNPKTGRLVFWNEFVQAAKEDNPGLTDEQAITIWRQKYGGR